MRYYLKALRVLVLVTVASTATHYLLGGEWRLGGIVSVAVFAVVEVLATLYEIRDMLSDEE
jgi:hypothetical protein